MKTLKNNFTTPEQSKRLLEIGVPADSADCYYDHYKNLEVRTYSKLENTFFDTYTRFTPCWTVGRLIEILDICKIEDVRITLLMPSETINYIDYLIEILSCKWLDFSKLED